MNDRIHRKLNSTRGISRLVVIMLIAIGVMIVILAIPLWNSFSYDASRMACEQAMKSAQDGLIIDYLHKFQNSSVKETQLTLDEVMPGRENLCPSGGTVYLVEGDHGVYEPVCGLHDRDDKRRTRLNASYIYEQLEDERATLKRRGLEEPESIIIEVNGKPLEVVRLEEDPGIRYGTKAMLDYEGIIGFYGVDDKGNLSFFIYADEDHCARWSKASGWLGDAYKAS